jgi:NAD(P)H-dependent nitrite reductase small subunit
MTTENRWIYVCPIAAIVPNTGVCAKVLDTQVAVFRVIPPGGGEEHVFAIANHDPKSGAMVLSRGLVGDLQGECVVASPIYKQHYALASGRCLEDESLSVAAFATRVADGMVLVCSTPTRRPNAALAADASAPAALPS